MSQEYQVPFNVEPGRIEDFVRGAQEATDQRARTMLKSVAKGALIGAAVWTVWNRRKH